MGKSKSDSSDKVEKRSLKLQKPDAEYDAPMSSGKEEKKQKKRRNEDEIEDVYVSPFLYTSVDVLVTQIY
jgi:hypothetical protein